MEIADLHIHSRFSRATSKNMTLKALSEAAEQKGITILGTGDFTHPEWLKELKSNLNPEKGFMIMPGSKTKWVLSAEVSNIYSINGRVHKIHHVILAPDFEVVDQINEELSKKGNLAADGRPIFGKFTSPELVELVMSISPKCEVIPAHIWTPWFSLFGSKSGFDNIKDCYEDQLKHIHALETGLSSDPPMNWRLSQLDKFTLVSNSDCHSTHLWRIGREANVINTTSYRDMLQVLRSGDPKKFLFTIEVDPSYGKYHYDGHRDCGVALSPTETKRLNNKCPKCGKPLTIGVLNRVEELADRPEGYTPKNRIPFKRLMPLAELISLSTGRGVATKTVNALMHKLINALGSEYNILLNTPRNELEKIVSKGLAGLILLNREGKIGIEPGYDGVYGKPLLRTEKQRTLTNYEPNT